MNPADWQKLRQDAFETIRNIDIKALTKDTYVLLGASYAILSQGEPYEGYASTRMENPAQEVHTADKSLREIIEDELGGAEYYYRIGEHDIARDELRHADRFLAVLKAQSAKQADADYLRQVVERRDRIAEKL